MIEKIIRLFFYFWNNSLFRFFVVGGINTLFGYGVFSLLIFLGLHYSLSSFISTVVGVLFNFKTTGIIVFKNKSNRLLLRFFAVYGIVYLTNLFFLYVANCYGVNNYLAGAVLVLPMALLSYVLNRTLVFSR